MKLVLGLGKTGLSVVRHLMQAPQPIWVWDSALQPTQLATLRAEFPNLPVETHIPENIWAEVDEVIISPGVPLDIQPVQQAHERGVPVVGDIALFTRAAKAPIIGVTGSNGKSTVAALLYEMAVEAGLAAQLGGNFGEPALNLLHAQPTPTLFILELSSFQLDSTPYLPLRSGVVLNVSPDHQDRYANFSAYVASKQRLYRDCEHPVFNRDDRHTQVDVSMQQTAVSFGLDSPMTDSFGLREDQGEMMIAVGERHVLPVRDMALSGRHNIANALAALAVGQAAGLPLQAMCRVLRRFTGLPHRCENVMEHNGVRWINDSKATNVGAAQAAIASFSTAPEKKQIILLAGGDGKAADFNTLSDSVRRGVRHAIVFGQDAGRLKQALAGNTAVTQVADLSAAVRAAYALADTGDTVLLSPACSSLDQFANFSERGMCFRRAVKECVL